jgi:hypothetical protein
MVFRYGLSEFRKSAAMHQDSESNLHELGSDGVRNRRFVFAPAFLVVGLLP